MKSIRKGIKLCKNQSTVDLTCKGEHQDFFCRNFSSQRTSVSNSVALNTNTAKLNIQASKILAIYMYGLLC